MKTLISGLILGFFISNANADLSIAAVGDVMLGNRLIGTQKMPSEFLSDVKPHLSTVDIAFANLEGPIGGNNPKSCFSSNCHTFSQIYDAAQILKNTGFNLLSVANNHARDMGESGMNSTASILQSAQIDFAGYPNKPFTILDIKGKKVGFIAFTANKGMPDYRNTESFQQSISELKKLTPFVIVSMHAGCEGSYWTKAPRGDELCFGENRGNIDKTMRLAVDSGADLVLGHGPHVPRGVVIYKGKLIAWSLGNFATAAGISVAGISGLAPMLKVNYDNNFNFKSYEIVSFKQTFNSGPKLDKLNMAYQHIQKVTPIDLASNQTGNTL